MPILQLHSRTRSLEKGVFSPLPKMILGAKEALDSNIAGHVIFNLLDKASAVEVIREILVVQAYSHAALDRVLIVKTQQHNQITKPNNT